MINKPTNYVSRVLIIISLSAPIALLSCSRAPSRAEVVKSYAAAVNSSDVDSLLSLFTDDAIVGFRGMGPQLVGLEERRAKAQYDSAMHSHLTITIASSRKDTVYCRVTETNDWTREAGLPPYEYSSFMFVIKAGKIAGLQAELADSTVAQINGVMSLIVPWAQENMPEMLDSLMAGGEFAFRAENARLMMLLLREWRESTGAN
jgi:hypothetical protein